MTAKHGMADTREYRIWCGMINRCENPNDATSFQRYGARGITICESWRRDFKAFYLDMGPAPSVDHSIERRDNEGNYEPGNCTWATRSEQARNRRNTRLITHDGRTLCVLDWAREAGIKVGTLGYRLRVGMPMAQALTTPIGSNALRPRGAQHWRSKVRDAANADKGQP